MIPRIIFVLCIQKKTDQFKQPVVSHILTGNYQETKPNNLQKYQVDIKLLVAMLHFFTHKSAIRFCCFYLIITLIIVLAMNKVLQCVFLSIHLRVLLFSLIKTRFYYIRESLENSFAEYNWSIFCLQISSHFLHSSKRKLKLNRY